MPHKRDVRLISVCRALQEKARRKAEAKARKQERKAQKREEKSRKRASRRQGNAAAAQQFVRRQLSLFVDMLDRPSKMSPNHIASVIAASQPLLQILPPFLVSTVFQLVQLYQMEQQRLLRGGVENDVVSMQGIVIGDRLINSQLARTMERVSDDPLRRLVDSVDIVRAPLYYRNCTDTPGSKRLVNPGAETAGQLLSSALFPERACIFPNTLLRIHAGSGTVESQLVSASLVCTAAIPLERLISKQRHQREMRLHYCNEDEEYCTAYSLLHSVDPTNYSDLVGFYFLYVEVAFVTARPSRLFSRSLRPRPRFRWRTWAVCSSTTRRSRRCACISCSWSNRRLSRRRRESGCAPSSSAYRRCAMRWMQPLPRLLARWRLKW